MRISNDNEEALSAGNGHVEAFGARHETQTLR